MIYRIQSTQVSHIIWGIIVPEKKVGGGGGGGGEENVIF